MSKITLIALMLFISMTSGMAVPKVRQHFAARVHEFLTLEGRVQKEEWYKLYLNVSTMQFHVEREFNDEYSEVVIYDNGEFYKYFLKYEETGVTHFNCTKGKPKEPLTKRNEPFNFVWIDENATDEGPLLFETYHAEAFKWEDRHGYTPTDFQWFVDEFGFLPD